MLRLAAHPKSQRILTHDRDCNSRLVNQDPRRVALQPEVVVRPGEGRRTSTTVRFSVDGLKPGRRMLSARLRTIDQSTPSQGVYAPISHPRRQNQVRLARHRQCRRYVKRVPKVYAGQVELLYGMAGNWQGLLSSSPVTNTQEIEKKRGQVQEPALWDWKTPLSRESLGKRLTRKANKHECF